MVESMEREGSGDEDVVVISGLGAVSAVGILAIDGEFVTRLG